MFAPVLREAIGVDAFAFERDALEQNARLILRLNLEREVISDAKAPFRRPLWRFGAVYDRVAQRDEKWGRRHRRRLPQRAHNGLLLRGDSLFGLTDLVLDRLSRLQFGAPFAVGYAVDTRPGVHLRPRPGELRLQFGQARFHFVQSGS